MENWLLIYNPASGGGKRAKAALDGIIETFQKKDKFITTYRLDRTTPSTIREVLEAGRFDGVLVCGGDGSVKSVGGLLAGMGSKLPLGVLPNGTCNDFARSLGLPTDLQKCAEVLARGRSKFVDIGKANDEYFVNELAGGIFVAVSYSVDNEMKQAFGPFAYYAAGMGELAKIRTFDFVIETEEGGRIESEAYLFMLLNGTDVSGMSGIIKEAVMDDGKMDILIFKKSSFFDLTDTLFQFVTNADFKDHCVERITTRKCTITCNEELMTTLDGEKGPALPLDIEILPRALNVLY